ncbi:hypothetical protein CRUP_033397, partial [Coryphaenoides rupestris]
MQTTLNTITTTLPGLTGSSVPAPPHMKDTIHHLQSRLDQVSNRSQVHDQMLLHINNLMQESGVGNDVGGALPPAVSQRLTELEERVSQSCSSCQSGVEDLRRQQKQDQDRIRALEKLLSSMDQNLKQSVEVSRRETERSNTCCKTAADLESRLASVEVHLRSTAGAYEVIKGRLDKELSGVGGSGKGRVTEDRLNGRLR